MKKFLSWLFGYKPEPCRHSMNWTSEQFVERNTPMVHFWCHDCGFVDRGHVHTDEPLDEWVSITRCVNGKKQ